MPQAGGTNPPRVTSPPPQRYSSSPRQPDGRCRWCARWATAAVPAEAAAVVAGRRRRLSLASFLFASLSPPTGARAHARSRSAFCRAHVQRTRPPFVSRPRNATARPVGRRTKTEKPNRAGHDDDGFFFGRSLATNGRNRTKNGGQKKKNKNITVDDERARKEIERRKGKGLVTAF